MSVSVVIPTYNQRPGLLDCAVTSAVRASADQVIVVDDGSNDPVVNTWGPPVEVHRIEHGGVSAAFNAGLDQVRCKWLCRMGSDDKMDGDKIHRQRYWMEQNGSRASFHDCRDSRTGEKYNTGLPGERDMPHRNRERWRKRLLAANRLYGGTSMMLWDAVKDYLHPDVMYCGDWHHNVWVEMNVGWDYLPEELSTIGRYENGLEAKSHSDPQAYQDRAHVAALIEEMHS